MARHAGTDRMAMDIRAELKKAATKGGRLFSGTARMFLDSTTELVGNTMPTVGAMLETNQDLINDTLRFIRNPVDALNRGMDRLSQDEGIKAIRKFGADAWDDLKTGNIYDPNRDRSGFGTSIDSLLDNFGDIDMSGFGETGDYEEPADTGDLDQNSKMLESHEQADDARTMATIEAVQGAGSAIIANARADAQTDIRLGVKQHAQLMGGMGNIITQQGALLETVNSAAASLLEVHRESHRDIMASLQTINESLNAIRENTGPVQQAADAPIIDDSVIGSHGALDIRKWLNAIKKNADEKYGVSSAISMATMGMSPKQLIELVADNPWKLVSDQMVSKVIPEYLKQTMNTTQKYMENFFPSLLAKFADQGRRFDKDASEGGGKFIDLLAGLLRVQPRASSSLDLRPQNIMQKAEFTNKTANAIENVIPMWLSKIYSAVSGQPLSMYNYATGEMESVMRSVADTYHSANDLAGRMGPSARMFLDRATDNEAFQFVDPEMEKKWESTLYQFMQRAAAQGTLLNPGKNKAEFMELIPDGENRELWYNMITSTLSHMPRADLMALNAEISKARSNQRALNASLAKDLATNGMSINQAMLDPRLKSELESNSTLYRYGLTDDQMTKISADTQKRLAGTAAGLSSTNTYLDEITSMLKRGIITYTHLMDDEGGGGRGGRHGRRRSPSPMDPIVNQIRSDAQDEMNRINRINENADRARQNQDERRDRAIRENTVRQNSETDPNKVWIRNGAVIDRVVLDQAQGGLVIRRTADGTSDNALTEDQRIRQDRENRIKGMVDGQVRRVKDAFGIRSDGKMLQKVGDILESPFKLVDLGLRTVDQFLFKMIYGEDVPQDLTDPDNPEKDPKVKSLMDTMTHKMKAQWASTKEWFKEYIGEPIKDFFLGEQGLLGKVKSRLAEKIVTPAAEKIGAFKDKVKTKVLGSQEVIEKYVDDPNNPGEKILVQEKGDYQGGILSSAMNKVRASKTKLVGDAKTRGISLLDTLLYNSAEGKVGKGRTYVADDIDFDDDGNQTISEGHFEYHGAVGAVREVVDKAKSTMWQWLFGEDENGDDHDSTRKFNAVKDEVKKAFPDMTIGAGIGLIGSIFLPGGPIIGSILGATGGLVAGSDKLKDYLFGEQDEDHETTKYNYKTGKIEVVKTKGRKGAIIPAEMQDAFKKFAPKMAIGAGLGVMGSMFLPGGPVVGAILGATGGMTAASDKLKQIIFGDGTDEDNGIISPKMRKSIVDAVKKNAPGVIGGGLAGAKLGSMLGAGLGLIPGLSLLPTGPIFTMLGGITGAIGGNTIQEFFFGQEKEVEEKDPETGEVKKVKKRVGGLFGKAYDYVQNTLFKSFGQKMQDVTGKVQEWFKSDVVGPLAHVSQPLKDAMEKSKNDIQNAFRNMGQHIKDSLDRTFENAFGKKMGEFFEEKIKKPLSNMVSKILGGIGKAIGAVISAPFKLLDYMVTGNTKKVDEHGNVLDSELDFTEKIKKAVAPKKEKKPKEKKAPTERVSLIQRFLNWRDKGTEEVDENMRNTPRYYDPVSGDPTATVGDVTAQSEAKGKKEKPKRIGFIQRYLNWRDKGTEEANENMRNTPKYYDQKPSTTEPPTPVVEPKPAKEEKVTENPRPEKKTPKTLAVKEDPVEKASAGKPIDPTESTDVKSAKKKSRSASDYLRSIDRTTKNIYKEIKGQLNGVGYNIAYIKLQFDKHLGKLKSDELDENMEGSTKGKLKRRRGFFGRAIDAVTGIGGRIKDKAIDMKDAAVEKVKDLVGAITKPFRMLGKAAVGATKAIGAFGRGLFDILGKIGKGIAEGLAGIFKGAGELLGKTLGGIGKMIWNAGAGIGKALGNTVALVSDVVKNFGSAVAAGIAGVAKVAATVVPDIATGIWKAVTGTAGALFKGVKWAGGKVVDGAKWVFNKVTGKDKKAEAKTTKATSKIADTISNGYMTMGIGLRKDVKPYPYVNFAKGKLIKALNNFAIPVWIMGSSAVLEVISRDKRDNEPDETAPTPQPMPRPGQDAEPINPGAKAPGVNLKKGTHSETGDRKHKAKAGTEVNQKESETEILRREAKEEAKENRKARDKFRIWKRGYKKVDTKAERSKNPGDIYDAAIDRAGTMEEAEGIIAAEGMNDGAFGRLFAGSGESEKKDEGGGLFDMLGGLLGGDGGFLQTLASKYLPKGLTNFLGGMKSGAGAIGTTIMKNIPFIAGTAMALKSGETDRVATNVLKQATGKGMKWLGKSATEAAVATVEGTAAKGLGAKAIKGFSTLLAKFLGNKTVQSAIQKLSPKLYEKVAGKGANELVKEFTKRVAVSVGSEAVQKLASKLNLIALVATAVYDFVSGMGNVGQYFEVSDADATLGMKLTSGLCKAISGFCFGLLPVGWLSQTIYGWFAGEEGRAELAQKQDAMAAKVAQYNRDNGTTYTVAEYAKQFDDEGNKRGFFNSIKKGFASAGTAIGNAWSGLTSKVSEGASWIGEKASEFGSSVAEKFKGGMGAIKNVFGAAADGVGGFFTETLPKWGGDLTKAAGDFWSNSVVPSWNNLWGGVGDFFTSTLPEWGTNLKEGWTDFWGGVGDKITDTFNSAKDWLSDKAEDVGEWAEDTYEGAKDWVGDKFDAVSGWVGGIFGKGPSNVTSPLKDDTSPVTKAVEIGKGIGNKVLEYMEKIYRQPAKVVDIFTKMGEGLGGTMFDEEVSLKPADVIGTLKNSLTHAFTGKDPDTGRETPNSGSSGGILGWFKDAGNSVKTWVSDKIHKWFGGGDESGTGRGHWGTGVKTMSQTDSRWNSGSGDMAKVGCGPTAAAMVASAYGKKSTPVEADRFSKESGMRASDGGTNPKFFSQYARNKGFGMSEGSTNVSSIGSNVAKGNPVILMGKGGAYGNNMHYMVADRVSGNGNIGVVDPVGGARKTVSPKDLSNHTSKAVYSYGKGRGLNPNDTFEQFGKGPMAVSTALADGGASSIIANAESKSQEEKIKEGQEAVLNQMLWLKEHPIKYGLGSIQDPDQGTASCASTVGWAYRKAFGLTGMSASSTEQSKNPNFETIWTNDGSGLDSSILKPGDVLYMNWNQTANTGAMKHTEMYAGNNKDISHGGPGAGPVYKDLNDYRRKHTMMVRRYRPLMTGEDIKIANSRGGGFGANGAVGGAMAGLGTLGSYGSSAYVDADGNTKFTLDSSGNISFLSNLSDFFGNITSKLSAALGTLMGIRDEGTADDGSGGTSSGSSGGSKDSSFTPVTGGTVSGNDVTAKVYNYLRGVGLSKIATAGIMGNLDAESGINPGNVQNKTYDKSLSNAEEDAKYIADVTSGAHDFIHDSKGYGLAQWTYWSRKKGLMDLINQQNAKLDDVHPQLQHLWNELNSYNLAGPLNQAKSVKEASDIMLHQYEAPKDQSASVEDYRASLSQKWYDTYAEKETPDPEATDDQAATKTNDDAAPGEAWGAGPGGISLGLDSLNTTVANINRMLSEHNSERDSNTTASAITKQITDSITTAGGANSGSDAMMQALVASMSKMVELLTTIADNTKQSTSSDPLHGRRSSVKDKPRIMQYPSASPINENGTTQPTSVGAEIVDKMTANRR